MSNALVQCVIQGMDCFLYNIFGGLLGGRILKALAAENEKALIG